MRIMISGIAAGLLAIVSSGVAPAQEAAPVAGQTVMGEALAPAAGNRGRYQLGTSLEVEWVDNRLQPPGQRRVFSYILDTQTGDLYLCQSAIEGVLPDPCGRVGYLP